jgi:monodechloroaminopyrrolnitrin synthase
MKLNLCSFVNICNSVKSSGSKLDDFFERLNIVDNDKSELLKVVNNLHTSLDARLYTQIPNYGYLRDFGLACAKLNRFDISPNEFPKFIDILKAQSVLLDTVPRDSVFTYGPMNSISKLRTFTRLNEEKVFIEAFSSGMWALFKSIAKLIESYDLIQDKGSDTSIALLINQAKQEFEGMVNAIKQVHLKVPPQVFTRDLRPFFNPLTIGDQTYLAPGGAGMPVLILDQILWSNEYWSDFYSEYFESNLLYLPKEFKSASKQFEGKLTIKQLLQVSQLPLSRIAFSEFCSSLLLFRGIHKKVADANFKLRPSGSLGSGGHTPDDILQLLVNKTFELKS